MVFLYGITLVPLAEELRDADPTLLSPFYVNNVAFYGLVRWCAAQVLLLMEQGPDKDYFPELSKNIFMAENSEEKEAAEKESDQSGLSLNYVYGSRYLGAYLGTREELEEWVRPKVEAWDHRVHILAKIAKR